MLTVAYMKCRCLVAGLPRTVGCSPPLCFATRRHMLTLVTSSTFRSCCRWACRDDDSHSTNSGIEGTEARLQGCLSVLIAILQDGADDFTAAFLKQQLRLLIENSSGQHGMDWTCSFEEIIGSKQDLSQRNRVGHGVERVFCSASFVRKKLQANCAIPSTCF